ncbi:MAG: AI-2E family transporter [Clostridia bacterium]|nr:AI-2E family transporter [Clostridia bacterium]
MVRIAPRLRYWILIALAIILAVLFIYWIRSILLPFLLALVLAYLLNPIVEFWQQKGLSRTGGIILTYLLLGAVILMVGVYFFPILWRQLEVLLVSIPSYTRQVQELLQGFYDNYQRINIPHTIRHEVDLALNRVEIVLTQTTGQVINGILGIFSYLFSIIMAPILAYFILNDEGRTADWFLGLMPEPWRMKTLHLWEEIDVQLIRFIKGHLLVASLVGLLTSIGFMIIGLEFPILLGAIVGVADIIPYFGPVIGAVPALAVGILHSKGQALGALVVIFVIQQLESNILSPKIIGSSVGLHPVWVIFVLLLGNKVYGILGMLLAVPVTITLRVLWRHFVLTWALETK